MYYRTPRTDKKIAEIEANTAEAGDLLNYWIESLDDGVMMKDDLKLIIRKGFTTVPAGKREAMYSEFISAHLL